MKYAMIGLFIKKEVIPINGWNILINLISGILKQQMIKVIILFTTIVITLIITILSILL
jgi:hypothetical protein